MKNMKNTLFLTSAVLFLTFLSICAQASTIVDELERITGEVAKLDLGFGGYVLGNPLTEEQKTIAARNAVKKALKGTYKFKDGEVFVVASRSNDTIIGIYKDYQNATMDTLKSVIGTLMLEHGEPTAMAHDKLVYWTYNENGKIDQDVFDFERGSGGIKSLVTVKFSSTEPIIERKKEGEEKEEKKISAYVMITSDPLSKLFLAQVKSATKL